MVSPLQARINIHARTDAKLQFARIHLEEITYRREKGSADAFERAHEESFLFHLMGAKDSFLQEINVAYELGLPFEKVTENELQKKLKAKKVESPALKEIVRLAEKLKGDKASWFAVAIELRNQGMHRSNIPRHFHKGGNNHDKVFFTNLLTGKPIEIDVPEFLTECLENMENLLRELYPTLPQESAGDI